MTVHLIFIGIIFSWTAASLDALGNVLFKYETVYPMQRKRCHLNWHRIGICLLVFSTLMAVGSISLLPITISSAGSALPIVFGELWSGFLLPHNKLDWKQWLVIAFIVLSVIGVVLCGDHSPPHNVSDDFADNFSLQPTRTIGWISTSGALLLSTAIIIWKFEIPRGGVQTVSILNILGPTCPGAIGNFTQLCLKLSTSAILCTLNPDCESEVHSGYYFLAIAAVILAIIQLNVVAYVMGQLVLTTAIPIYQASLIVLPALSSMFLLGERPSHVAGYVTSLCCLLLGLGYFIVVTADHERKRVEAALLSNQNSNSDIEMDYQEADGTSCIDEDDEIFNLLELFFNNKRVQNLIINFLRESHQENRQFDGPFDGYASLMQLQVPI